MEKLIEKVQELINTDKDRMQELITKFIPALRELRTPKEYPYLAYIFNISFNYLDAKHKELSGDIKAWALVVIKEEYFSGRLETGNDIINRIEDFIEYWNPKEYEKYCEEIIPANDYGRDSLFVRKYIKKIGSK